jgi:AraC-like DNA-binding protein
MQHFRTISEMHRAGGLLPPLHPLISLYRCGQTCSVVETEFTSDFYLISLKKLKAGIIRYGQTKYDHANGSMAFIKPRQVAEFRNLEFEEDAFIIFIHEDFLHGHPLHSAIKKYGFFEYEVNEALHLSPKEEELIWDLYNRIDAEYRNNPDEFSRNIMLTHIDSILTYAQRFYKRQFIDRAILSTKTVSKFNEVLTEYLAAGSLQDQGLPTVTLLASKLHLSSRYLSDLLKEETGKTAMELIHIHLISEAKNLLKGVDQSVGEIAYTLGFENLPYFSRLFKKEVGVSPTQYKRQYNNMN